MSKKLAFIFLFLNCLFAVLTWSFKLEAAEYYSVQWPQDWITKDLTKNKIATERFSGVISYIGGRPKDQTTLYQHAIIILDGKKDKITEQLLQRWESGNSELKEKSNEEFGGKAFIKMVFQNKADPTNKTSFYIADIQSLVFILELHAPSGANYLNEMATQIKKSLKFPK